MGTYNTLNRKIGDGYTYYKGYTPDPTGADPYGEPTLSEIITDDQTFGGTDPTGAEVTIEREMLDDEISQEIAPIQRLVIGESAIFKITVPAGRLANLAVTAGRAITDIADISNADLPRSNDGKGLLIGGEISLNFWGLAHEITNSVSPNLREWVYMPRCQAGEGFAFSFKKNEIRMVELSMMVFPALQDDFIVEATRHALMQVIFEI